MILYVYIAKINYFEGWYRLPLLFTHNSFKPIHILCLNQLTINLYFQQYLFPYSRRLPLIYLMECGNGKFHA